MAACGRCVSLPCAPGAEAGRAAVFSQPCADLRLGGVEQPGGDTAASVAGSENPGKGQWLRV